MIHYHASMVNLAQNSLKQSEKIEFTTKFCEGIVEL